MKLQHMVAAVLAAAPILASAQATPAKPAQTTSALVARIKTNVAQITEPTEKDRWQANLELWQLATGLTGPATKADLDRMKLLVDRIFANTARITDPAEKGRWQANVDMWKIVSTYAGQVPKEDLAKAKASFARMKANVATITAAKEKERWQANRDLWRAQLAKLDAAA